MLVQEMQAPLYEVLVANRLALQNEQVAAATTPTVRIDTASSFRYIRCTLSSRLCKLQSARTSHADSHNNTSHCLYPFPPQALHTVGDEPTLDRLTTSMASVESLQVLVQSTQHLLGDAYSAASSTLMGDVRAAAGGGLPDQMADVCKIVEDCAALLVGKTRHSSAAEVDVLSLLRVPEFSFLVQGDAVGLMTVLLELAEAAMALSAKGKVTLIAELGELTEPSPKHTSAVLFRVLSNATKATPDIIELMFKHLDLGGSTSSTSSIGTSSSNGNIGSSNVNSSSNSSSTSSKSVATESSLADAADRVAEWGGKIGATTGANGQGEFWLTVPIVSRNHHEGSPPPLHAMSTTTWPPKGTVLHLPVRRSSSMGVIGTTIPNSLAEETHEEEEVVSPTISSMIQSLPLADRAMVLPTSLTRLARSDSVQTVVPEDEENTPSLGEPTRGRSTWMSLVPSMDAGKLSDVPSVVTPTMSEDGKAVVPPDLATNENTPQPSPAHSRANSTSNSAGTTFSLPPPPAAMPTFSLGSGAGAGIPLPPPPAATATRSVSVGAAEMKARDNVLNGVPLPVPVFKLKQESSTPTESISVPWSKTSDGANMVAPSSSSAVAPNTGLFVPSKPAPTIGFLSLDQAKFTHHATKPPSTSKVALPFSPVEADASTPPLPQYDAPPPKTSPDVSTDHCGGGGHGRETGKMSFAELNHGRANVRHALNAANDLGLDLESIAGGRGSFSPSNSSIACRIVAPIPDDVVKQIQRHRLDRRRALVVCPRPGYNEIVCEYLQRWSIMHDSGPTFRAGAAKIRQTNEVLKAQSKRPQQVNFVVADIDESLEDPNRRVPDAMLSRNIRFIFLYSDRTQITGDGLAPWFAIAKSYTLLKKPFRREDFWAALLGKQRSEQTSGTTMTLPKTPLSPQRLSKSKGMDAGGTAAAGSAGEAPQPRILLVEDDRINVAVAKRYMSWAGYEEVAVANNGVECLNLIRATLMPTPGNARVLPKFAIILMDCQMPVMDGFEATQRVREIEREQMPGEQVPIIAMTGFSAEGERAKCIDAGMTDHMSKPFDKEKLKQILDKYLLKSALPAPAAPTAPAGNGS